jgi:hypothetical protein
MVTFVAKYAATPATPRNTFRSGALRAEYYKFDALSLRQPKSFVN